MNEVLNIKSPLNCLNGVGPRIHLLLKQRGLETVQDLLFHLPHRYEDRTRINPIAALQEGDIALIEGEIRGVTVSPGRKVSLLCQLADHSGSIYLRFFHFNASQKRQFEIGTRWRCFGEIRRAFRHFGWEMIHPEYRQILQAREIPLEDKLTPVYPLSQGLSQALLRKLSDQALTILQKTMAPLELIPDLLLSPLCFSGLAEALHYVHRPPADADVDLLLRGTHPMQQRLAFEELVAHQLSLQKSRYFHRNNQSIPLAGSNHLRVKFQNNLGFAMTAAQKKVIAEIDHDLEQTAPMLRLLQGDVGSGKTAVAAMAMLSAVAENFQTALCAPTELLAEQHFQQFSRWFTPLGIEVGFLAGKQTAKARREMQEKIATGAIPVIIGTHALFQEQVNYARLALLVIDEQHRFGVNQRWSFLQKGSHAGRYPHQLIMSATPIPRTLTMAAYADLDISIIDELPPGRVPVVTVLVSQNRRQEVIERVRIASRSGNQVYWVCTLIEDSEVLQCQTAERTAAELQEFLPELRIGLVHSRLPYETRAEQMQQFKANEIQVLVATTVIEVGVDVPNANLMIIENPERLGLSQLHQLRGRVGRGAVASYCVLLFQEPLSQQAQQRLQIMRKTHDGFIIAQEDLALRGPGEVLGTRQSGLAKLKMADLSRDQHLLPQAQAAGKYMLENCPSSSTEALIDRWLRHAEHYIEV